MVVKHHGHCLLWCIGIITLLLSNNVNADNTDDTSTLTAATVPTGTRTVAPSRVPSEPPPRVPSRSPLPSRIPSEAPLRIPSSVPSEPRVDAPWPSNTPSVSRSAGPTVVPGLAPTRQYHRPSPGPTPGPTPEPSISGVSAGSGSGSTSSLSDLYSKWNELSAEDQLTLNRAWSQSRQAQGRNEKDFNVLAVNVFGFTKKEAKHLNVWLKYMSVNNDHDGSDTNDNDNDNGTDSDNALDECDDGGMYDENEDSEEEDEAYNKWVIHYDYNMVSFEVVVDDVSYLGNANSIEEALSLASKAENVDMFTWHTGDKGNFVFKNRVYGWSKEVAKVKGRDNPQLWRKEKFHHSGIRMSLNRKD